MNNTIIPEWRPVIGFEGFYEVSNTGLVRSLDRVICVDDQYMKNNAFRSAHKRTYKGVILTAKIDRYGYPIMHLRVTDRKVNIYPPVHKLVAQAFIGLCPEDKSQINHKDSDKMNNHVDNLEWCTNSENHKHSYKNGTHALNLYRCPETGMNMGKPYEG